MHIVELFVCLANNMLDKDSTNEILKTQPDDVRNAFELNDNKKIKLYVSNRQIYANEVKVTCY